MIEPELVIGISGLIIGGAGVLKTLIDYYNDKNMRLF